MIMPHYKNGKSMMTAACYKSGKLMITAACYKSSNNNMIDNNEDKVGGLRIRSHNRLSAGLHAKLHDHRSCDHSVILNTL